MQRTRPRLPAKLARRVTRHVIEEVWSENVRDYRCVAPGIVEHHDRTALVVMGAADVQQPGIDALRVCGHLWEMAVLIRVGEPTLVCGPRHLYDNAEWSTILSRMVALTTDTNVVLTIVEAMAVESDRDRANAGAISAAVGSALPTEAEPDQDLIDELLAQLDHDLEAT